jgi:uncharacterized paraquat-inducible protein A
MIVNIKQNPRVLAAQMGKTRYIGNACKVCQDTERYTANGNCVTCQVGHNRAYQVRLQRLLAAAKADGRLEFIVVGDRK